MKDRANNHPLKKITITLNKLTLSWFLLITYHAEHDG